MNIYTDHMGADEVRVARLIGGIEMLATAQTTTAAALVRTLGVAATAAPGVS